MQEYIEVFKAVKIRVWDGISRPDRRVVQLDDVFLELEFIKETEDESESSGRALLRWTGEAA
jgi:hypothetical protein